MGITPHVNDHEEVHIPLVSMDNIIHMVTCSCTEGDLASLPYVLLTFEPTMGSTQCPAPI